MPPPATNMALQVTVVFKDLVTGDEGREPEHVVEGVAATISIAALKEKALSLVKAPGNPSVLLYMGSICLEDNKTLADYNRSKRTTLTISVLKEVWFNIKVKTLQNCNAGICLLVPMWALCLRQTISISVPSHVNVAALKKKVAEELDDHDRMSSDKLVIAKGFQKLTDDSATLLDMGIVDGTVLTLYVPCCYYKGVGNGKTTPTAAPENQPEVAAQKTMNDKKDEGEVQKGEEEVQNAEGEVQKAAAGEGKTGSGDHPEGGEPQTGA